MSKKYIAMQNGALTEVAASALSVGAADAGKVVALNDSGILDDSILNASVVASANKIAKLTATGRLDITVMPLGVGDDTNIIVASEALAAGDFVNVWDNSSVASVRKADASAVGKEAHGFVLAAVEAGIGATVFFEGTNTSVSGCVPGRQFLSLTAGGFSTSPPTAAGQIVQVLGYAVSSTAINFQSLAPIALA